MSETPSQIIKSKRRCFIISPIGAEHSPERDHANEVLNYIIKPALEQNNIDAIRSDELHQTGRITEQMLDSIFNFDLCIAVLTFKNPNVYYELAIAQCANRPIILLMNQGETIPFDIKDLRCVVYDLKISSYEKKIYINQIGQYIKELEKQNWITKSSLPGFPVNCFQIGMECYKVSQDFGNHLDWEALFNITKIRFDIMSVDLGTWRKMQRLEEKFKAKTDTGCKIRILMMHPDNPMVSYLNNERIANQTDAQAIENIKSNYEYYKKISNNNPKVEVRLIKKGCITHNQMITDECATYIPYFYANMTENSPLWKVEKTTDLYKTLVDEFEMLWKDNFPQ